MKQFIRIAVISFFLVTPTSGFSEEGGHSTPPTEKSANVTPPHVGPQFAVTDFSQEDGFKLSEKAIQRLGVQFLQLEQGTRWNLPKGVIVRLKNAVGVYRRVDGWIAWVPVTVVKQYSPNVTVESPDLQSGDEVAAKGTSLLRVTEVHLTSDSVDGCAH